MKEEEIIWKIQSDKKRQTLFLEKIDFFSCRELFLLFFAVYVIYKKNYSFSRVVFLFFQSKTANSLYSKINDSSVVRTTSFWSSKTGFESLLCQIFLRFILILMPEISETLKGSSTKFFGTVRQKSFEGNLWYPQLCIKFFDTPNFLRHWRDAHEIFRRCETKNIRQKIENLDVTLWSIKFFDTRN